MAKKTKARRWRMRISEGWLHVLVNPAGNDMVRSNRRGVIKRLRRLCNIAERQSARSRDVSRKVERLTADGVPVTPGAPLYYVYITKPGHSWVSFAQDGTDPRFCYSTREAAEAARKKKKKKKKKGGK